jgi:hypothetical protein
MDDIEKRAVTKFLTKEEIIPKNIHDRMIKIYGKTSISYATVKKWRHFLKGKKRASETTHGQVVQKL